MMEVTPLTYQQALKEAHRIGRYEGLEEVVDWIEYYLEIPEIKDTSFDRIVRPQLEIKKKDWGL